MPSIDRLSALSDELISHILSFLPFETSLSTRTLSPRWRRVWAYAPNIKPPGGSIQYTISERTEFVRGLTKILSQCEAHGVNRLSLPMDSCNEHEVAACLESAFACNVKILYLILPENLNTMPPCGFTSKTLVDLTILYLNVEMKKGDVCLPALKRLCLRSAHLQLGCSLESLISGCPVLEDLTLDRCLLNDGNVECYCISSPTMKRLVLRGASTSNSRLKLDTPDLVEADVDVWGVNRPPSLVELLGRVTNVKDPDRKIPNLTPVDLNTKNLTKLTVRGDWRVISYFLEKANKLEVLDVIQCSSVPERKMEEWEMKEEWEMEEFLQSPMANSIMKLDNLTKLEVTADWWFLTYLLEKADKLKVLIIRYLYRRKHDGLPWLAVPHQVPNCLSSHLKIVQVHEFDGTDEHEVHMVGYLLKNAEVLERMELHWFKGMERHYIEELIERISSFDRGSEMCEIVFNQYLELGYDNLGF